MTKDDPCYGCAYRQADPIGGARGVCGYSEITDMLRGCPPGDGCIRYSTTLRLRDTEKERWNRELKKSIGPYAGGHHEVDR